MIALQNFFSGCFAWSSQQYVYIYIYILVRSKINLVLNMKQIEVLVNEIKFKINQWRSKILIYVLVSMVNFHFQIRPILMSTYITVISVIFSFKFPNLKYSYGNHTLSWMKKKIRKSKVTKIYILESQKSQRLDIMNYGTKICMFL